ncbi:MAG: FliO/MopB family protein [Thermacetogeniaceae bacterium]
MRLVVSLTVVIGLAFVVIKYLQKRTMITQTGRWIRVIDQVGIGPNKALLLTEIAGRLFVLGVTDHSISNLMEIKETSQVTAILEESLDTDITYFKGDVFHKLWRKPFHKLLKTKVIDSIMDNKEGE